MTPIRTLLAAALLIAGGTAAFAEPGTMVAPALVYSGPDSSTTLVNKLPAGIGVDVGPCSGGWCQITQGGVTGYAPQNTVTAGVPAAPQQPQRPRPGNNGGGFGGGFGNGGGFNNDGGPGFNFDFNFGNEPQVQPPRPPRPQAPRPSRNAEACFYSNTGFRGSSFCVEEGQSYDYLPDNWDNRIRSVEVFGGARVDICRDEDLRGACATLRSSQERLPNQLDRRASSLEVY